MDRMTTLKTRLINKLCSIGDAQFIFMECSFWNINTNFIESAVDTIDAGHFKIKFKTLLPDKRIDCETLMETIIGSFNHLKYYVPALVSFAQWCRTGRCELARPVTIH